MNLLKNKKRFWALAFFLSLTFYVIYVLTYAPSPAISKKSDYVGRPLNAVLHKLAKDTHQVGVPGVILTVFKDERWYEATAGHPTKSSTLNMPLDEPLRLGSISKTYTAAVILQLQIDGQLNIDDKITQYLPSSVTDDLDNADEATIKQLLMHTSGIPDYYDLQGYFTQDWSSQITLERVLPFAKRNNATHLSGATYEYSNMGYVLLGEIAEIAGQKPLKSLIQRFITKPLNLPNTFYDVKHSPKQMIHGYGTLLLPWADTYDLWEHSGPDAGITATAKETITFLRSLQGQKGVMAELGQLMLSQTIDHNTNQQQSLGLHILLPKSGDRLIGHSGNVFGYQTIAYTSEQHGFSIFAHITCDCTEVSSALLKNLYQAALLSD